MTLILTNSLLLAANIIAWGLIITAVAVGVIAAIVMIKLARED